MEKTHASRSAESEISNRRQQFSKWNRDPAFWRDVTAVFVALAIWQAWTGRG